MNKPVTSAVDKDGVGWITWDDPEAKANLLSPEVVACFRANLGELSHEPGLKAVVIRSGKENVFSAGANLHWVESLQTQDRAETMARNGHEFLHEIASFYVPVIAAIPR